jgi:hypothetical protein
MPSTKFCSASRAYAASTYDWYTYPCRVTVVRAGRSRGQIPVAVVNNFNFSIFSRQAPGSTQPPTQRVSEALFPRVKRQGHEADHSPPTNPKFKKSGSTYPLRTSTGKLCMCLHVMKLEKTQSQVGESLIRDLALRDGSDGCNSVTNSDFLERRPRAHLLRTFIARYGTRKFIAELTRSLYLFLS